MLFRYDLHGYTLNEAIYNLDVAIALAKRSKKQVLELIVGYGSKGGSHKIKTNIIEILTLYRTKNKIKDYLLGEHLDIFNLNYQTFKYRQLLINSKCRNNKGVIYIIV